MAHVHKLYDFTTSAFILHPTEEKFLLLFHDKIKRWLQPGGHIELNEDPLQALYREISEETGLNPQDYVLVEPAEQPRPQGGNNTVLPLPFYFNVHPFAPEPSHKHIDICYLAHAHTASITEHPDGASEIAWLTLDEIQRKFDEKQVFKHTVEICEWIAERHFNK